MGSNRKLLARGAQEDADAKFRMGYRLAFGRKRAKKINWREIHELWLNAANCEHERAQFYLATLYEHGQGVRRDLKAALYWYRRGAANGNPDCIYNLAYSYRAGDGVRKNLKKAIALFREASQLGDAGAQRELGYAYFHGRGVVKNQKSGVSWYRRAAKGGDEIAQYNLSLCYLSGDGLKASRRWAVYWLKRSAPNYKKSRERLRLLLKET